MLTYCLVHAGGGGGGFNFSEWGDNFKRSLTGFFQTVATILLFAAALGALALWKPLLSLLNRVVSAVVGALCVRAALCGQQHGGWGRACYRN